MKCPNCKGTGYFENDQGGCEMCKGTGTYHMHPSDIDQNVLDAQAVVANGKNHPDYVLNMALALVELDGVRKAASEPPFACAKCGASGEFYKPWHLCEDCVVVEYPELDEVEDLRAGNQALREALRKRLPELTNEEARRVVQALVSVSRDLERTAYAAGPEDLVIFGHRAQEYREVARKLIGDSDIQKAEEALTKFRGRKA